jgi:hypothetical protein
MNKRLGMRAQHHGANVAARSLKNNGSSSSLKQKHELASLGFMHRNLAQSLIFGRLKSRVDFVQILRRKLSFCSGKISDENRFKIARKSVQDIKVVDSIRFGTATCFFTSQCDYESDLCVCLSCNWAQKSVNNQSKHKFLCSSKTAHFEL